MGCIVCPIANMFSTMLYSLERIAICGAATAMIVCIMSMMVITCLMGVALGYHFCRTETLGDYYYEEPDKDEGLAGRRSGMEPDETRSIKDDPHTEQDDDDDLIGKKRKRKNVEFTLIPYLQSDNGTSVPRLNSSATDMNKNVNASNNTILYAMTKEPLARKRLNRTILFTIKSNAMIM